MSQSAVRARVLVGAILIQLILGTLYGYSIFWRPLDAQVFPPVVTEADFRKLEAGGTNRSEVTVVADDAAKKFRESEQQGYLKYAFSICILSFAGTMVVAGRVQDLKGPRVTATIGGLLMGGGFLVAGHMNHFIVFYLAHAAFAGIVTLLLLALFRTLTRNADPEQKVMLRDVPLVLVASCVIAAVLLGQRYVGQLGEIDRLFMLWGTVGFLAGAGIGFAYVCPIAALIKWFPERKGLVSGIAVAGFGFGAYIFSHPQLPFSAENYLRAHGIASLFTMHGLFSILGITLGASLLINPPATPQVKFESTWQDTLRRPAFYTLWLMFFSGAMAGLMVIGILKGFAGEQLVNAAGGTTTLGDARARELFDRGVAAVGWLAVFNALGRIVWGMVSDRVGRTTAFVTMFLFQAMMMFSLGGLDSELSLAVGAAIVGFNFGGNFALFPSATADLFGAKNLGANFGWVFTSYGIAGVVGIFAGNAAKVATGSYAAAFSVAGVLCIVSAGLAIGMHVQRRRLLAQVAAGGAVEGVVKLAVIPVTPYQQNCSLVICAATGKAAFVDPGGEVEHLLAVLGESGATLEKILVTHGHVDHCGGVAELAERTGVPVEGPQREDAFWIDQLARQGAGFGVPGARVFTPDRWVEGGDTVTVGNLTFVVRHCPGHTPGHVVFVEPERRIAFVGDVLFQGSVGRTDFPRGDFATLVRSITGELWPFGNDVQFVPGHGPMSTFGEERRNNPFVGDAALAR